MKKLTLNFAALLAVCAVLGLASCSKDDGPGFDPYETPTTYNFSNVDYSEAATRVSMWAAFNAYLGFSTSRQLSADTATFLWNNTNVAWTSAMFVNNPKSATDLNAATTIKLSASTVDPAIFKGYIDQLVGYSASYGVTASNGTAGKLGTRLVSPEGHVYGQLVNKGLMGGFAMSEMFKHLDKVATDDNNTVVNGSGTAMQHDWDMAFGYVGIPKNYDSSVAYVNTDVTRPLGLGGYFRERGRYIKAGGIVFGAFLKGRAAIVAKDYASRDQAIATIKENIEKLLAAAAFAYSTNPQTTVDQSSKFGQISEGYGFAIALKYRPANSKLTAANHTALLDIFKSNYYTLHADANNTKLKEAAAILRAAYGQLQAE